MSQEAALRRWEETLATLARRGPDEPLPAELVESFLFPLILHLPDHLHMLFGALERVVSKHEVWGKLQPALHHHMLSRERFPVREK